MSTYLAKVVSRVQVGNFLRLAQRVRLNHAGSPLPRARAEEWRGKGRAHLMILRMVQLRPIYSGRKEKHPAASYTPHLLYDVKGVSNFPLGTNHVSILVRVLYQRIRDGQYLVFRQLF